MANEGNIVIDPSVIKERSNTYSSLTDINKADVFTSSYEIKVAEVEKKRKEQTQELEEAIFAKEPNEGADTQQQVKDMMFVGETTQVEKEMSAIEAKNNELVIPIIGIVLVIIFVVAMRYMDKRKSEWEKRDADTYNYE